MKEKKKPRGGNSPVIGMNGYNLEPGDNTRITLMNLEIFNLPEIDMHDVNQVADRLSLYFEIYAKYDMKPTVSGMGLALNGMSRQMLWAIANDRPVNGQGTMTNLPSSVSDLIKKTYKFLESQWENYMQSGKINPVSGIFLAKNNFGYVDKTETVITPNTQKEQYSAESIKSRYLLDENEISNQPRLGEPNTP
mgnify:CR=1 FL=1